MIQELKVMAANNSAEYTQVAQSLNNFYHAYPVIHEEDPERRAFLLWMTDYFRARLERTLGIFGMRHRRICKGPGSAQPSSRRPVATGRCPPIHVCDSPGTTTRVYSVPLRWADPEPGWMVQTLLASSESSACQWTRAGMMAIASV